MIPLDHEMYTHEADRAALAAEGRSTITQAWHLDRGYARFVERLRSLGAEAATDS